jgi:hypothetical protein
MPLFGKRVDGVLGRLSELGDAALMPATILTFDRSSCATIVDVSAENARLQGCGQFAPGDNLWLKVGCVDCLATVAWCDDDLFEVIFDAPLSHEDLIHLRCEARNTLVTRLAPEERVAARSWINAMER